METIRRTFAQSAAALAAALDHLEGRIADASRMIVAACRAGKGVYLFGNGGSACDSQHIATELVGRYLKNRRAIHAQALTADTAILTAVANDFSFERIFVRQLEAAAGRGDVAWALSTSGNSPNVVAALRWAKSHGLRTIALTGQGGGKCAPYADILLDIPASATPRVQEAGMVVYHLICEIVENAVS
jgi:D-sedoheptulose 7-phosphate isomerase